ncbi:MAG: PspC domain-containing protein [bacterium]|nr:PspC domain-containing protein [bacterium]MCP4964629.1 PspC domain-containing protein [bacterium]
MQGSPDGQARLTRSRTNRKLGGVAGGLAEYLNIDPTLIRIVWLILLVMGPGFILYIVAWIAVPEADEDVQPQPIRSSPTSASGQLIMGGLLVAIGGALMADRYLPWMKDLILPVTLVAVGTGVVVYSLRN